MPLALAQYYFWQLISELFRVENETLELCTLFLGISSLKSRISVVTIK